MGDIISRYQVSCKTIDTKQNNVIDDLVDTINCHYRINHLEANRAALQRYVRQRDMQIECTNVHAHYTQIWRALNIVESESFVKYKSTTVVAHWSIPKAN